MRIRAAVLAFVLPAFAASAHAYRISIWIPSWSSDATTSIQQNAGSVQESNPVWYSWNSDGTIAKNWNAESPTIRAAMTGTRVVPTIQNVVSGSFDGNLAATVLGTSTSRDAHVAAIFNLVTTNAYDGIDIDYERVPSTSRTDFTTFVNSLAQKLHSAGKTLSVTVYAKASDAENWNGPGAEDWTVMGAAADSVKIMAYDYSWSTSPPGPITPLTWLDQVATYAESTIPAAKIFIGLPFYGYDWSGGTGTGVSYATATQTAQSNGATISHDVNGEATFTYGTHTVYFQDAYAYAQKMNVIAQKHPAITGLAHWAAGQEDPMTWSFMTGQLPNALPAQPAPADFAIDGPSSASVQQGSATAARFTITAINGFSGSATVTVQALSPGFEGSVIASASSITARNPLTLVIAAGPSRAGVYDFVVRFTSGSVVHEQTMAVTVIAIGGRSRSARH